MDWLEIGKIFVTTLASFGGASVVVLALSKYLGDIWSRRILATEKLELDRKLADHKGTLDKQLEEHRVALKSSADALLDNERSKYALELAKVQAEFQEAMNVRLEQMRSENEITNDALIGESKARRDYHYEARKRLYAEIEPLLFQLTELAEGALAQIESLARTARNGNLDPPNSWLGNEEYYMVSTLYRLFAPLAVIRLIQRRMTTVDLTVDPHIAAQYAIAKWIYLSFSDDFVMANPLRDATDEPVEVGAATSHAVIELPYSPNDPFWKNKRLMEPARYWRQGFPIGVLDKAAELMLIPDSATGGALRHAYYGEFEVAFWNKDSPLGGYFKVTVLDVFHDFHPRTRPVLWRILITQAHLYRTLLKARDMMLAGGISVAFDVTLFTDVERRKLDWRQQPAEADDFTVLQSPYEVTASYAKARVKLPSSVKQIT